MPVTVMITAESMVHRFFSYTLFGPPSIYTKHIVKEPLNEKLRKKAQEFSKGN